MLQVDQLVQDLQDFQVDPILCNFIDGKIEVISINSEAHLYSWFTIFSLLAIDTRDSLK